MSMAPHTSKSITAMGWQHSVRSDRGVLVCEAWDHHGDCVEATGRNDFDLRRSILGAVELVERERQVGASLV